MPVLETLDIKWIEYEGKQPGKIFNRDGEKIYITDRKRPFEMERKPGFSISKGVLNILVQNGVTKIRVLYMNNGRRSVYQTTPQKFQTDGKLNYYGSDAQLWIPMEGFDVRCE